MKIYKFDLVVALYIFGIMVAELMGGKTFPVTHIGSWDIHASTAIFVLPLLYTITDVIVEVYGRKRARSVVFSGISMVFLLMLFSLLAVHLPATERFAPREAAYDSIFGTTIRLAAASLVAFAVSELLDVAIFSRLRQKMQGRALWFRNNASNIVSLLVDSTVFLTLAFYSFGMSFTGNAKFLIGLIIPYWTFKCLLSAAETPLVYLGVRWLRGERKKPLAVTAEEMA